MWKWAFIRSFYGTLLTNLVWSKWLDIKSRSFFASCPQQYNYAFKMVYFPRGFAQFTITYNESVGPFVV